jgi:hypothetical protein
MLMFLQGLASDRKLRLFACACVRRVWHLLPDERSHKAVEMAEQFADGLLDTKELIALPESRGHGTPSSVAATRATEAAFEVLTEPCAFSAALRASQYAERAAQYAAIETTFTVFDDTTKLAWQAVEAEEEEAQAALLRDLFGETVQPLLPLPTSVLTWSDSTVARFARGIYEERQLPEGTFNNTRLAVLADTLEKAGCQDSDILAHCHQSGVHVQGCWVVDLLLDKK